MNDLREIVVLDDAVPSGIAEGVSELMRRPIWGYGWRSNRGQDRYSFWHAHFAGKDAQGRESCLPELLQHGSSSPIVQLWHHLSAGMLKGHEPLRVYANAHTFGVEGYVHTDSSDEENYFTTIYYAHPIWRKNWSGELIFFSDTDEIIAAYAPRPGRLILFRGSIQHKAQAPGRECPELRVSLVFKTQLMKLETAYG